MAGYRLLHAASLRLDTPMQDVAPFLQGNRDQVRETMIDASFLAWEQIVLAAIEHEVEIVLLHGDTFCEADDSLRARTAIREGIEELDRNGIATVIIPGTIDPIEAWETFYSLPASAVVFDGTATAIDEIALVPIDRGIGTSEDSEITIGIASAGVEWMSRLGEFDTGGVSYVAHGGCERNTIQSGDVIAHRPGSAQAVTKTEVGARHCTLVEFGEADSIPKLTAVDLGPVRRDVFDLRGDFHDDDALIEAMWSAAEDVNLHDELTTWLIEWNLPAGVDNPDAIARGFAEAFESDEITIRQTFSQARNLEEDGDELAEEFIASLDVDPREFVQPPGIESSDWQRLVAEIDPNDIRRRSLEFGRQQMRTSS